MPRRSKPSVLAGEGNVAARVALERETRGWSTGELAARVTETGCPLSQSAVWRIESGTPRRKISVDELLAFCQVFGRSIGEMIEPVTEKYPTELIELYIRKWLESEEDRQAIEIRANMNLDEVVAATFAFPGSERLIREIVQGIVGDDLAFVYLQRYDEELTQTRKLDEVDYMHMGATEVIILGRGQGRNDAEILQYAAELGMEEAVADVLQAGVTHFVESHFAGYISIDDLEIVDGRVTLKSTAGLAAKSAAAARAKDLGLPDGSVDPEHL